MHEAKYEPMDKVDAEKIMEEILGMQAGLNPDQQVDETSASIFQYLCNKDVWCCIVEQDLQHWIEQTQKYVTQVKYL